MKILLLSLLLLTGCASVFRGEGVTVSAEVAKVGQWDNSYYLPSMSELKRFIVYYRNRTQAVQYSVHWDCDDWARDFVNSMCRKYASFPFGGESPAAEMHQRGNHMVVLVETSDLGVCEVDPQVGTITKSAEGAAR